MGNQPRITADQKAGSIHVFQSLWQRLLGETGDVVCVQAGLGQLPSLVSQPLRRICDLCGSVFGDPLLKLFAGSAGDGASDRVLHRVVGLCTEPCLKCGERVVSADNRALFVQDAETNPQVRGE